MEPNTEGVKPPEQQEMLAKAIKTVADLYIGEQISNVWGLGAGTRDESWISKTRELGMFSDKAKEIGIAVRAIAAVKKALPNPSSIDVVGQLVFADVKDSLAKAYLTDVLFSRVGQSFSEQGEIYLIQQSEIMAQQMGIKDGWRSEPAKEVTLEKAIGATLEGKLKVTHQQNADNNEAARIVTGVEVDKAEQQKPQPGI